MQRAGRTANWAWRAQRVAAACALALLAACAGPRSSEAPLRVYDFGIEAPAAKLAGVRIGQVRAAAPLDSTDMLYRLAYRNPAEVLAFTQSRWAAPPAELLRRRFSRAAEGAAGSACLLELELLEVSQVFTATDSSEALLEVRAWLSFGGARIAERTLRVSQAGAGGNAASGAGALTVAVDRGIAELARWSALQGRCSGS